MRRTVWVNGCNMAGDGGCGEAIVVARAKAKGERHELNIEAKALINVDLGKSVLFVKIASIII